MVRVRVTTVKVADVPLISRAIESKTRPLAQKIARGFGGITRTWKNEKPEFRGTVTRLNGWVDFFAGAEDDGGKGFAKLLWLDEGTRVRYAVMTPNFRAKTSPRNFLSGRGQGGLSHFDFRHPKPGIRAREWAAEATELYESQLHDIADAAVAEVAAKYSEGN